MKQAIVKQKNININSNFLSDKWIWISLVIVFGVTITLFTVLATLIKTKWFKNN